MKYITRVIFFTLLFCYSLFAQEGWFWQNPLPQGNTLNSVHFINQNNGIVVGNSGTILKTTNAGINWTSLSSGTTNSLLSVSFIDIDNGWVVGLDSTILHTTNGGVTFIEEEPNPTQPNSFLLSQNYPNPFNPSTKIKFTIPTGDNPLWGGERGGLTTLKIYDILGREVATLVNEQKPAGEYEIEFNSGNFPSRQGSALTSGIYFYQLKSGNYIETKKMILLK